MRPRTLSPRSWRAPVVGIVLGVGLVPLLATGPTSAAHLTTPESSAPVVSLNYRGVETRIGRDEDGAEWGRDDREATVGIECDEEGTCAWFGLTVPTGLTEIPAPVIDDGVAISTAEWAPSGSVCADTYVSGGTLTVRATATELVFESTEPWSGWQECDSYTTMQGGVEHTLTAAFVGGDVCILDADGCAVTTGAGHVGDGFGTTAGSPSSLSGLATPADTLGPGQVALAAGLTVVLIILIALPTALIDSTIATRSGRVPDRAGGSASRARGLIPPSVRGAGGRAMRTLRGLAGRGRGLPAALVTVVVAGIVSGFVQPGFGVDAASFRLFLSIALGFTATVVTGWFIVILAMRRLNSELVPRFASKPAALLFTVAGVAFTRLTDFEPGIVIGLVAGVAFGATLTTRISARLALLSLGWGLLIAIACWIGFSILDQPGADDSWGTALARETLAAVTITGLAAIPVALAPVSGLPGRSVWNWSRRGWAVGYAVGLLAFFLVLIPMPLSWDEVRTSLPAWILIYLAYAAIAVVVWLVVGRPWQRRPNVRPGEGSAVAAVSTSDPTPG